MNQFSRFSRFWKSRGIPTNLSALKYANAPYSQFGEDRVLMHYLKGVSHGTYVDIGCFDPIKWSNTYLILPARLVWTLC